MVIISVCIVAGQTNILTSEEELLSNYIQQLDEVVNILDNEDKDTMVLYNDFDSGAYLEFKNYVTYIDPRADSFTIEANNDFDYLTEYYDFVDGKLDYKKFTNKYHFTHLVLDKSYSSQIENISNDDNFEKIFENNRFIVFKSTIDIQ